MEDKTAAQLSRGWKCDNCGKRTTSEDTHDNNWETVGLSSDTKDFCGAACAKTWGRKHPEELEGEDTWLTETLARERRQQQGHIATATPGSPEWYAENPIPDEDRQEHHRDAPFYGVGLDHNDDGWTIHTHRAEWPDRFPSPEQIPDHAIEFIRSTGRKLAHGGGDDPTVHHCPMCGSGQVVARSDGTVECQFCKSVFEVTLQPQFSNMPQTDPETGLPIPGAEDEELPPGADPGVSADAEGVFVPPGDEADPMGGTDGVFVPPDQEAPVVEAPPKAARLTAANTRIFRSTKGDPLPEEWYIKHLAIVFADDRDMVLDTIRRSA